MATSSGNPDDRSGASTSRSLLARLHTNDPAAWERLIALYAPLVWSWCRKMNLAQHDVADIFQEVFKSVAAHYRDFHKDRPGDTFRGWLRTITRNKVHDHFRRRQREPMGVGGTDAHFRWTQVPETDWDAEELSGDPSQQQLFRRALELIQSEFEPRTWQAFWRVVVDGQTPQEAAAELGMTAGSVRVAKCRVLHRLRQELGDIRS